MALDTVKWLTDDLGFTEAEAKELAPKFDPKAAAIEKGFLRQSDYSKHMDALTKAQNDLKTQTARLETEMAEWATLTASEKENATKQREALEAAQQKVLALQQRVTRIATDAGLDPAKALEGIEQVVPPKKEEPKAPEIDTSKFVGVEQFGSMSEYLFNLSVELPLLAQEHFDLTGERLDTRALRTEITKRASTKGANLDPRAIWEETYKIAEKRNEKSAAARQQEIAAAEQRGFERARSEGALPVAPSNGQNSPVLRTVDGKARESVLQRPAPESGVRSAAQALATGKYRQQDQKKSA